eukprot:CAMPEP_0185690582 /NCGR_PEP_ID=MMETSP1164-20130828/1205_1 /TAXON_ID=1104430 /ORGANISM="Chrysoreinhardia sp, Strain CCMP2950" /LENGTH=148 /DNA_ID=CAMNT_0028357157 /DNA_START=636 /DNA_END=1079 /DNA_ORIENTATION=+
MVVRKRSRRGGGRRRSKISAAAGATRRFDASGDRVCERWSSIITAHPGGVAGGDRPRAACVARAAPMAQRAADAEAGHARGLCGDRRPEPSEGTRRRGDSVTTVTMRRDEAGVVGRRRGLEAHDRGLARDAGAWKSRRRRRRRRRRMG